MPKAKLSQASAVSLSQNKGKKAASRSVPKQKSSPARNLKKVNPKNIKSKVPIKTSSKNIKKVDKKGQKTLVKKNSPAPVFGKGNPKLPKKVSSPFNIFSNQMQNQMKAMPKFKDITVAERTKVVKESWDKLTADQMQQYVMMANEDKKRYQKDIKKLTSRGVDVKKLIDKRNSSDKIEKKAKEFVFKPKQIVSAYLYFVNHNRPLLKKENPDISLVDVTKKSATQWNSMNDKQKEPFVKQQQKDALRHEKETKQFKDLGYFINSDGVKSTFLNKKGVVQEFQQGTNMPKRVKTSYMMYAVEQMKSDNMKEVKVTERIKKIAAQWNAFTDKQKQKFEELSKQDNERYQSQLNEIRKKGFFMTEDGKKSSDLPKKIVKAKTRKSPAKK